MSRRRTVLILAWPVLLAAAGSARADITNTLHNFTPDPSSPATIKNPGPVGLCAFCHTPHRAGQTVALWNRQMPTSPYDPYQSSTLLAAVGQPTGSSRLCLSCHDGTVALGNVLWDPEGLVSPLPPVSGRVLLGTDLTDDHPVSFVFDESLTVANGELVSPSSLTGSVRLDRDDRVQCTSCHDPHSDTFPKFLRETTENGALCLTCHTKRGWTDSSHATSLATWNGLGTDPWPGSPFGTVAQNACLSCHDPHSAAQTERLFSRAPDEEICLACHNGNVARTDVAAELAKPSHHPVLETSGVHDAAEDVLLMDRHVFCADCHNPHAVTSTVSARPPDVPGRQLFVDGVDLTGTPVDEARFAYEICFKCHGLAEQTNPRVVRLDHVTNVRLEISPSNPSYHPVTAVGANPNVVDLCTIGSRVLCQITDLTPTSQIYCHDCHNTNEVDNPGPATPVGPHGSEFAPILAGTYPLVDFVQFDPATYSLCFRCHDQEVLRDTAPFEHKRHLENGDVPCAACHDPHGSRIFPHLINFMRFDASGAEVVSPSITTGRLEFIDLGDGRGRCFLNCHGEEHNPRGYIGPDKE